MSDQVSITVHRRLPDGTWPPGEAPIPMKMLLATLRCCGTNDTYVRLGVYANVAHVFMGYERMDTVYDPDTIVAWADVTEVLR